MDAPHVVVLGALALEEPALGRREASLRSNHSFRFRESWEHSPAASHAFRPLVGPIIPSIALILWRCAEPAARGGVDPTREESTDRERPGAR